MKYLKRFLLIGLFLFIFTGFVSAKEKQNYGSTIYQIGSENGYSLYTGNEPISVKINNNSINQIEIQYDPETSTYVAVSSDNGYYDNMGNIGFFSSYLDRLGVGSYKIEIETDNVEYTSYIIIVDCRDENNCRTFGDNSLNTYWRFDNSTKTLYVFGNGYYYDNTNTVKETFQEL